MKELLSPKQVAASIGVSESSLKRWCDQGVIPTERTPGGHRRIRVGEVIRFLRDRDQPLVRPEVLGLPTGTGQGPRSIGKASDALMDALSEGDGEQVRRLILDMFLSGNSIIRICEEMVVPAMHSIGDGWECGDIEIYQEHRASEIMNRVLYDLRIILPPLGPKAPVAIGGTPPGDYYRLATMMVELVLVSEGWNAISLGSSLPFATLASAVNHHKPSLFWLSLSHIGSSEELCQGFDEFLDATPDTMPIVIGGQQVPGGLKVAPEAERVHYCRDLVSLRTIIKKLQPEIPQATEVTE